MEFAAMFALLLLACTPAPRADLRVLAAASLTDALPEVARAWEAAGQPRVAFTFDGTSRLARQLDEGAPADLFLSADEAWTDWGVERGLLDPATRRDLLGGSLVAVVPAQAAWTPADAAALADARVARLGLAGESVPAGRYARAALRALDAWAPVEARVVQGDSVRAVLGWTAHGEVDAGVVYATDARVEPQARVAFTFPAGSHPPIRYPAAVTRGAAQPEAAAAFATFCATGPGRAILERAGFQVLAPP